MAAGIRPTRATYEVHENVQVDTIDNEDHTFCGILFPIKAKQILPVERVVIYSIAVRGMLGPLTVWVNKEDEDATQRTAAAAAAAADRSEHRFRLTPRDWVKIYEKEHAPSPREYDVLDLGDTPIILRPGQVRAVYIHSSAHGDRAIVYDNSPTVSRTFCYNAAAAAARRYPPSHQPRYEDGCLRIGTGEAHISPRPFSNVSIWGWDDAWRGRREFVGRLNYSVVYKLWNPEQHGLFGRNFHQATVSLLSCQRRFESPVARLPDDCVYYILNMCRWDWFLDEVATTMKAQYRRIKQKRLAALTAAVERQHQAALIESARCTSQCNSDLPSRECAAAIAGTASSHNASEDVAELHTAGRNGNSPAENSGGNVSSNSRADIGADVSQVAFSSAADGIVSDSVVPLAVNDSDDDQEQQNHDVHVLAHMGLGDTISGTFVIALARARFDQQHNNHDSEEEDADYEELDEEAGDDDNVDDDNDDDEDDANADDDVDVDDDDVDDVDNDDDVDDDDDDDSSGMNNLEWVENRRSNNEIHVFSYHDISDDEDDAASNNNNTAGNNVVENRPVRHFMQLQHGWLRTFLNQRAEMNT